MPTRPLPHDPSLEHLRKQAKHLRKLVRAGEAEAVASAREFHPHVDGALASFSLVDAQLVTARSYGFSSWPKLKAHLTAIQPFIWNPPPPPRDPDALVDMFLRLACLVYGDWHRSNPEKARRLLDEHPEVAHADIYTAAAAGDAPLVRAMIGSSPALVDRRGGPLAWEPLLYACYSRLDGTDPGSHRSTLDVARVLLAHGANPNAGFLWAGSYAFTALTGAFGRGEDNINQPPHPHSHALASLLLEAGADPNDTQALYNRHFEENDDHFTLLFAHGLGQDKGGPWLKRLRDPSFNTPARMLVQELCWASMHGFLDRVKLLVGHGVDVNTPSLRDGRTPYEEALRAGHRAIAEYLLQRGAKKIELDRRETFALACIAGHRDEALAMLAEDPALLEKLGQEGRVDLIHRAVAAGQAAGVRLIVDLGIDVNGMIPGTGLDRAPLHGAPSVEMVTLLLELGADPTLRDPTYHATPIAWANHGHQKDIVDCLMRLASIFDAVQCDGVERVEALLQQNPALAHALDDRGYPPVFYLHAEMARLEEMIRALVAHGADLNVRNKDGMTRLDVVLARGLTEFAAVLRAHGAKTSEELTEGPPEGGHHD